MDNVYFNYLIRKTNKHTQEYFSIMEVLRSQGFESDNFMKLKRTLMAILEELRQKENKLNLEYQENQLKQQGIAKQKIKGGNK